MTANEIIEDVRQMARCRVERLNSEPGQRMDSMNIFVSGELISETGLKLPSNFDFKREFIIVNTAFHNNNGMLVAVDHSIWRMPKDATAEPEFVRFGLGEFMSDVLPSTSEDIKSSILNLPREKWREIYLWMYSALGCRV